MQIKAYVHADKNILSGEVEYKLYPFSSSIAGSIVVCEVTAEVDVPTLEDFQEKKKAVLRESLNLQIEGAETMLGNLRKQLESL